MLEQKHKKLRMDDGRGIFSEGRLKKQKTMKGSRHRGCGVLPACRSEPDRGGEDTDVVKKAASLACTLLYLKPQEKGFYATRKVIFGGKR